MIVKFWGVRGSIPVPGLHTAVYGGNTSCIEIKNGEDIFVIDAGSGIRLLGDSIKSNLQKYEINLFLTHTHWDHIQGLPFFSPIFDYRYKIIIHGPSMLGKLKNTISGQMGYIYFPVKTDDLASYIEFRELEAEVFRIGDTKISSIYLYHPTACLGYSFEYKSKKVVVLFDFEADIDRDLIISGNYFNQMVRIIGREKVPKIEDIVSFASDADVLIIDAQYTKAEYQTKRGWGHSSIPSAINIGFKAKSKRIVLFHLDPSRKDEDMMLIEHYIENYFKMKGIENRVYVAREGMEIEV
ncbi:MAG: MBL fold metallo-hydrolase [Brevinematales bacterium]|nr:MBL fold metallo-hydrolase [Brevinematales bacterium]